MGGEDTTAVNSSAMADDGGSKKRKESTPPEGYVCRLCSIPGHWIQVCPTKKTGTKRQRKSDHVPVPGQDPSPEDIERAKELQKIPPPKCFCGLPSRLNKVKRSKEGGDTSRAIGKYFFFCSKKRDDETQCRFARPVEMELNKKKGIEKRLGKSSASGGAAKDKKGGSDKERKPMQVCKFYAKNGTCKKGMKCEFSHDVQGANKKGSERKEKVTKKQAETPKVVEKKEEDENGHDGSSSSSSESGKDEGAKRDNASSDSDDSSSSEDDSD